MDERTIVSVSFRAIIHKLLLTNACNPRTSIDAVAVIAVTAYRPQETLGSGSETKRTTRHTFGAAGIGISSESIRNQTNCEKYYTLSFDNVVPTIRVQVFVYSVH